MPCSKLHAVEVLYSGKSNQCKGEDDGDTENTVRGGDDQSIVLKSRGRGRTSSLRNNGHAHYCCASEHVGEKTKRC